jgi:hypothetical protein
MQMNRDGEPPAERDLDPVWWLGVPVAVAALRFLVPLLGREAWQTLAASERTGWIENGTVALLVVAVVYGVRVLVRRRELPGVIVLLVAALVVGSFFFAGEESSWGQWWFRFKTPKALEDMNEQGEFGLHNITGMRFWLNATPRRLLMLATLAGGIVLPLAALPWRRRLLARRGWLYWLVPTWRIVPAAVATAGSGLPHRLLAWAGVTIGACEYLSMATRESSQECRELGFAMVILVYLVSMHARLGPRRKGA